jgi:hypothetical protein
MVAPEPEDMHLEDAIQATQSLFLRELPSHVCVGPMPRGAIGPLDLPLKDLDESSPAIKHYVDLILDIPKDSVDVVSLKAIFRDQAWDELPAFMKPKVRPSFETITQYILLPQSDGQLCLLKHVYITNEKVSGSYVATLLHGTGREIAWGNGNKKVVRKAFQWMLEQLGGTQFQKFILTSEKKKQALASQAPEEEGWTFLREHGELDKSDLKQLRWIHFHINRDDSPIKGWPERLVQKALDSLANDSTIAKLCERYDLTISDVDPEVRSLLEIIVPHLRDHALWLLGEPGKGKTPLGRILAMMFSRFHGGSGTFRTSNDLDFFKGIPFTKCVPALYDDGSIGDEETKKKRHSQTWVMMSR